MKEQMEITVTRHAVDGFTLSTVYGGEYFKHRYIDYTLREAKKHFRAFVKEGLHGRV